MKRLLKVVLFALFILVIGVTMLIALVNPNEYRDSLTKIVEEKTDYKLAINGELRWRVWPKISLLVDDIELTAPGAERSLIKAENMRLDIRLWPLIFNKISVKEILLKGVMIRLTNDTHAVRTASLNSTITDANVGQKERASAIFDQAPQNNTIRPKHWRNTLNKIQIVNGTLVLQKSLREDDLLTLRNVSFLLNNRSFPFALIEMSGEIQKNRETIALEAKMESDLNHFPKQINAVVNNFTYHVQGVELARANLQGNASLKLNYLVDTKDLTLSDLRINANGNMIQGEIKAAFQNQPNIEIKLQAENLNLDNFIKRKSVTTITKASNNRATAHPDVVITSKEEVDHKLAFFTLFNGDIDLNIKNLSSKQGKITAQNTQFSAKNRLGEIEISHAAIEIFKGKIDLAGNIDARGKQPFIQLALKVENLDIETVNRVLEQKQNVSGTLMLQGNINGIGISRHAVNNNWVGAFDSKLLNAKLNNVNLSQMILQAIALTQKENNSYKHYTLFNELHTNFGLNRGEVNFYSIDVHSDDFMVNGSGYINLLKSECDFLMLVKLLDGWPVEQKHLDILKAFDIPVKIYGPCDALNYQVESNRTLRNQLRSEASKAVDNYRKKNKLSDTQQELSGKLLEQLSKRESKAQSNSEID